MKKLPKIFKNNINKPLNNNNRVYYSGHKNNGEEVNINDLFKQNEIYRANIFITLKDGKTINKTIIGRSIKHLITMENELIPIEDILSIKKGN